mmetsp:Transcript_42350/g.74517  ORF Transcript_42350/g.74517 Transcript_42350/m.74517 type:complete len:90 (+) Transcript_42350:130-399(+)
MVKLCYSAVFKTGTHAPGKDGPVNLNSVSELSFISYFSRKSVLEMFNFFCSYIRQQQFIGGWRAYVCQAAGILLPFVRLANRCHCCMLC